MNWSKPLPLPLERQVSAAIMWRRKAWQWLSDPASLIVVAASLAVCALVLYPIFWLFYGAFTYGGGGFHTALTQFWQMPGLKRAFENTLWLLLGTVPLSFLFALPLVWITARTDTPCKNIIDFATLLPFITPPLIGAVAWSLLAAPRTGLINVLARVIGLRGPVVDIYSMGGLIFVMSLYLSPYVFVTVKVMMERMDASLEEASAIVGGSLWQTIRRVIIPLCMPAIVSAAILVVTRALEEFAIPGVLGAPSGIYTLTTYIYYQAISYVPPRYDVAAILAMFLMAATGLALGLQSRLIGGRRRFTTMSGKGRRPKLIALGRWRYLTLGYALLYLSLTVVLPYMILVYAALIKSWGNAPTWSNLTLANFASAFAADLNIRHGLFNSLLLALSGATLAVLLTVVISYMISKTQSAGSRFIEFISTIPLAMPGPVMAVAVLWAYLHPPAVLYGTLWILLVAYITHYLPYGVRTITGSFRQVSVEFERASEMCGASRVRGFRSIMLPLVRPGVLAAWMLMFVSMIRELSSSIFLFVPGTETTAVTLLEMWQEANFSAVAILSLTLIGISLLVVILVRFLSGSAYLKGTLQ